MNKDIGTADRFYAFIYKQGWTIPAIKGYETEYSSKVDSIIYSHIGVDGRADWRYVVSRMMLADCQGESGCAKLRDFLDTRYAKDMASKILGEL